MRAARKRSVPPAVDSQIEDEGQTPSKGGRVQQTPSTPETAPKKSKRRQLSVMARDATASNPTSSHSTALDRNDTLSPNPSNTSAAVTLNCAACAGRHRPHTCGKALRGADSREPGATAASGVCAGCAGRHRPHTCAKRLVLISRRSKDSSCAACEGRHRAHTCGKGTGPRSSSASRAEAEANECGV